MYLNPDVTAGIIPLYPQGTNSTLFTECCRVAICDDQPHCPGCGRNVVGWDAESEHQRRLIRWRNATSSWKHNQ